MTLSHDDSTIHIVLSYYYYNYYYYKGKGEGHLIAPVYEATPSQKRAGMARFIKASRSSYWTQAFIHECLRMPSQLKLFLICRSQRDVRLSWP